MKAYRNGGTWSMPPGGRNDHERGKRGEVKGWTAQSVRRHTKWLYSIDAPRLDGYGYAPTLTVRDLPPSAEVWHAMRDAWLKRLRRHEARLVRHHWLVEWQRRGVPHLHAAVYFARELTAEERASLSLAWVEVARDYGATMAGQTVNDITGPVGWLKYLSKHAARGVAHYQRQGVPDAWEKSGRMWGHGGEWPADEPLSFSLDSATGYRYRRMVRAWRIADARAEKDPAKRARRIVQARRMLQTKAGLGGDRDPAAIRQASAVRGTSEWVPEHLQVAWLSLLADQGGHVLAY